MPQSLVQLKYFKKKREWTNTISTTSNTQACSMLKLVSLLVLLLNSYLIDPLILYYGGYRYNQPNHLLHQFLMVHGFAYFLYDSIIEVYYQSDDLLTNLHHVCVVGCSFFHVRSRGSGFEYRGKNCEWIIWYSIAHACWNIKPILDH